MTLPQSLRRGKSPLPDGARFPPYGRRIYDMRARNLVPSSHQIAVAVGDWKLVNNGRGDCVVLPAGKSPSFYDWRFVIGMPVMMHVRERDFETACALAQAVIAAGCSGCSALIIMPDKSTRWHLFASHFSGTAANA